MFEKFAIFATEKNKDMKHEITRHSITTGSVQNQAAAGLFIPSQVLSGNAFFYSIITKIEIEISAEERADLLECIDKIKEDLIWVYDQVYGYDEDMLRGITWRFEKLATISKIINGLEN